MTWHETIEYIRKSPEYSYLVDKAYFEENLVLNVERFAKSDEYEETMKIMKRLHPSAKTILEIGAGNGVAAINFSLNGYDVVAVEPDPSDTVGANAIRKLITHYGLSNIQVFENYAEEIGFDDESFDIVYVRQAMHHAYDLKKFIKECARVIKKGGFLLTVRDHVIFDEKDKEWFLQMHPLQKFYGGENAFKPEEYRAAFQDAGLEILQELKYYDSVVNYFPVTTESLENKVGQMDFELMASLRKKISYLAKVPGIFSLYKLKNGYHKREKYFNEKLVPGRMYSYITKKK